MQSLLPATALADAGPGDGPSAQDLLEHFPLPGLILSGDSSVLYVNEPGKRRIAMQWIEAASADLQSLAYSDQTRALEVIDPAGVRHVVTAYATPLDGQTVVILDDLASGASSELAGLRQRINDLEKLSVTDRLTGLWNRRYFDELTPRELAFADKERSPVCLLLFDIDHFKSVNDRFGHAAGDEVLRTVAERLRKASRPTDLLFRWGGEEFALLTPATSASAAAGIAERIRTSVMVPDLPLIGPITVSVGVAEHGLAEPSVQWFERVDAALYEAKESGRNRVVVSAGGASETWRLQQHGSALQLVWSDRYASGHPLIDEEHRGLFDDTNVLLSAMTDASTQSDTLLTQVDKLLADIERHFADEERVLAAVGYPALDAHRQMHEKLLQGSRRLSESAHAGLCAPGEIVEFLAYEVINRHIIKIDHDYFPFVTKGDVFEPSIPEQARGD